MPHLNVYRDDQNSKSAVILTSVLCLFIFSIFAVILALYYCKARTETDQLKLAVQMQMAGDDNEPLRPTNVKPTLTRFRLVREEELHKGSMLGCGAFGTVYKGLWIPEGQHVKIPVAVKELKDRGNNASKEFLDEAYIMALMEHKRLLKLLAVCMSFNNFMLLTPLMPLGCLLDYVRTNKDKIGSKAILNWCTQIADGKNEKFKLLFTFRAKRLISENIS